MAADTSVSLGEQTVSRWVLSLSIFGLCADVSLNWCHWCSVDGTGEVLVVWISCCRAFLSWVVMNHASLWCFQSEGFLSLLCKSWEELGTGVGDQSEYKMCSAHPALWTHMICNLSSAGSQLSVLFWWWWMHSCYLAKYGFLALDRAPPPHSSRPPG